MSTKLFRLKNQLIQSYSSSGAESVKSKLTTFTNNYKLEVPERFKGTIVEKWMLYWRNLLIDYRDVFIDIGKQSKARPIRTAIYAGAAAAIYSSINRNPTETDFLDNLRKCTHDMMVVSENCHNPVSAQYVRFLERCYNEGIIRRLNLGVCSLLWLDNYDKALGLYKTTCTYLQPEYLAWHTRIIDVGFWNVWWQLQKKMTDYDVNENNL